MISIHALLAESDLHIGRGCVMIHRISIHALLAESDGDVTVPPQKAVGFLSTLSLRRATFRSYFPWPFLAAISIHALLAESDAAVALPTRSAPNFYPRSPCGERRRRHATARRAGQFLSTLSLRRATRLPRLTLTAATDFYPRSPCGERPRRLETARGTATFLSTLSLRRATKHDC